MIAQNKKVLICDDSLLIRSQLTDFIRGLGREIETLQAANGEEAAKLFEEHRPPLVLLDVVMPGGGGIECLKRIRAIDPQAMVIIVSSSGTSQVLKQALDAGATDFVQKPWNAKSLEAIISRVFG